MHRLSTGLICAAAVGAISCGAAFAADLPSRTAPPIFTTPVPVQNWAGFYAGSVFGWGFADVTSRQTGSNSVSFNGQTGGGLIGYNWQNGPFVYGVDGDITLHLIRTNMAAAAGVVASHVDTLYTGRARARLGYDLGNFLPFIDAGVATNEFYQADVPAQVTGSVRRATGWTAGAGVDWRVSLPLLGDTTIRAEYVYEDYPSTSLALAGGPIRSKLSTSFVRLALISQIGAQSASPATTPARTQQVDWSGSYGGALVGFSTMRARTSSPGAGSTAFNASGALGGVFAGRNFTFGPWVLGIDGSIAMTDFTGNGPYPVSGDNVTLRNYIQTDIRGRVGYAFGRLMPYFAAGAIWGRSEQRDQVTLSEIGRIPSESWTVGAGLEYMLTDRLSLRGEYLYEDTLDKIRTNLTPCPGCSQTQTGNLFRVGLAYYF
ncbi:MAG TPA: outer membrane beta-barrel protein, partial [Beijerinckiaceae bacterium]|nr:outer membrane beta-barrel protein [Beijerinckiaceae bacterium]